MILTKLTLHNYSAFRGTHTLDFSTHRQSGRNITLIGGKNGCGKTSILEALRLCLYGPPALGLRVADASYWEFLQTRINDTARKSNEESRIELGFTYSIEGISSNFHITRSWKKNRAEDKTVSESLSIQKDGTELDELEKNHWQAFINGLIPPGISHFFFFDAEQIERLIDERTADVKLKESVYALLNLDVLGRLNADLDGVRSKILRRRQDIQPELTKIVSEIESLSNESSAIHRNIETRDLTILQTESRVREIEQTLFIDGESVHDLRAKLKAEKSQLEESLREYRKDSADAAANSLPFAIVRELSARFEDQLKLEHKQRQIEASKKIVRELLPHVCSEIKQLLPLSGVTPSAMLRASEKSWDAAIDREVNSFGLALHHLSDSQGNEMVRHIHQSQASVFQRLRDLENKTEIAYERMKALTSRLNRLAQQNAVPETQAEYRSLTETLARERAQQHVQSTRHDELLRVLSKLRVQRAAIEQDLVGVDLDSKKIQTAAKVSRVIESLFDKLAARKLLELSEKTTEIYKSLARKRGLIREIRFSDIDMQVQLVTKDGSILNRSALSAGEKQMLAVSILWALGKVSGRNLPIIIDTPLARLDSDHRDSFVLKYLPRASHQVVVLSTDTEIDRDYSEKLEGHIAAEYLLQFNTGSASTEIKKGYFFGGAN